MASPEDVAIVRAFINEPDEANGWTDERLAALIDEAGSVNQAASTAWVLKAGQYATLVDVTESGSSRKLSDLRKNAMEMATYYRAADGDGIVPSSDRPIVQRIRRGFV